MKKYQVLFLFIAALFIVTNSSCKKDDDGDSNNPTNSFSYLNTNYEISNAYLEYFGEFNESDINFDLWLFTDGISYVNDSLGFSGTGDGLYFEMFTNSDTGLESGTYTYDANETGAANTFDICSLLLDYSFDTYVGSDVTVTAGSVVVVRNEASYDVTFNLTSASGNSVSGEYHGLLPIIY